MKKELVFITIIVVSAVMFFMIRSNVTRKINREGQPNATAVPTVIKKENFVNQITLNISEPADKSHVTTPNIIVSGNTSPGADVTVNDIDLKADAQGNFSTSLILDPGDNIIDIVANDDTGNYSEKEITVVLDDSSATP